MREHRPEAAERFGRDARPELRDVPLEVGADEIGAPAQARGVGSGEQTLRKSAAQPEGVDALSPHLAGVERGEFQIADATCERLAGLFEQVHRRRPQDQETPLAVPAPPTGVDEPAQAAEEVWRALDLVEDDERVLVLCQVEFRLGEFGPVGLGL